MTASTALKLLVPRYPGHPARRGVPRHPRYPRRPGSPGSPGFPRCPGFRGPRGPRDARDARRAPVRTAPRRVPPDRRPFAARQTRRMIGSVEVRRAVLDVWCVEVGLRSAGGGRSVRRASDGFLLGPKKGGYPVPRVSGGFLRARKKTPRALRHEGCGVGSLLMTGSLPVVSDGAPSPRRRRPFTRLFRG